MNQTNSNFPNKTQINNAKMGSLTVLIMGIFFCLIGIVFKTFLVVGIVSFIIAGVYYKKYKDLLKESEQKIENSDTVPAVEEVAEPFTEEISEVEESEEIEEPEEPITQERFDEMKNMCSDIHKEYKELLKGYSGADTDRKVYILKECYRKLAVMESTILKYNCYDEIDLYGEAEKIEKKAKSFINSYIKEEREDGAEDFMIDIIQFVDDLSFIYEYIYDKDEKLNKF